MKRRGDNCGKMRRPGKRSKIAEGIYSSTTFVYVKFLLVWAVVLLADFLVEFRFEYLWPFWLLVRSVYDSFKYQGLAFSLFFILIAVTSDVCCFIFIPVHWLFFAASTYVWVQYVWHTERGICLPTVSLWLLFVYIEASVRLKELKPSSTTNHLDLCRPFAAHCIGYPVVTLGFGVKSYLSYRIRLRRQREVAKENDFYHELVDEALPEEVREAQRVAAANALPPPIPVVSEGPTITEKVTIVSNGSPNGHSQLLNGHHHLHHHQPSVNHLLSSSNNRKVTMNGHGPSSQHPEKVPSSSSSSASSVSSTSTSHVHQHEQQQTRQSKNRDNHDFDGPKPRSATVGSATTNNNSDFDRQLIEAKSTPSHKAVILSSVNDFKEDEADFDLVGSKTSFKNSITASLNSCPGSNSTSNQSTPSKWPQTMIGSSAASSSGKKKVNNLPTTTNSLSNDNHIQRLEGDIKRLKADLQASRQTEQDLRAQVSSLLKGKLEEERLRSELEQVMIDKESLQTKLHNMTTARQQDKANLAILEKKVQDEKKLKASLETQLVNEKERKKAPPEVKLVQVQKTECSESCKAKKRELESDLKNIRRELKMREDQFKSLERETHSLRVTQAKESGHGQDMEILMSALSAMQEKNAHLEASLSAETRLKLDLFSALGDTKRQLEISHALMTQKDKEIDDLKAKIAEVMACMPSTVHSSPFTNMDTSGLALLFNSKYLESPSNGHRELPNDL